jgi:hypothetical protein
MNQAFILAQVAHRSCSVFHWAGGWIELICPQKTLTAVDQIARLEKAGQSARPVDVKDGVFKVSKVLYHGHA